MRKLRRNLVSVCALTLAVFAARGANPEGVGVEAARAQLKELTVGEGLEATLYACEPMVVNPADMDIDARGRVWVTEGANYRLFQKWGKLRPEGDRIVIMEDTDGDGLADKATTFYQGNDINTALGICVLGNKVIVSSAPNVFVLTDTDGDDKADKKEVLFTGISGVDHDHAVHAFNFGPDGKLYFNFGNAGGQLKRPDGTPVKDREGREINASGKPFRQGMVFRCNIDGSDVEVLGNNFRNNYEVCVDSMGTMWQSDNDDDGNRGVRINYVMDYGNFGYTDEMTGKNWGEKRTNMEKDKPEQHWHLNDPGVVPNLLQTGNGSPTGILFYEGNLLPSIFQHSIIHCDAGPRVVRSYTVKPDGAGYKASIVNVLTTTNNNSWFRPSDVCTAPDGSVYVADWNDAAVGGHFMADQKLETMSGRIYRVAPKGNKQLLPRLDLKSTDGLVEALRSPNNATRYLAWTKLHEMGDKVKDELSPTWHGDPDPYQRARAFELLVRLKDKSAQYLAEATRDKNPDIRNLALRYSRVEDLDSIPLVKRLVKDKSPVVRRECALSLRHNRSSDAPELWAQLAQQHDGKDRWYLEALGIGADQQEDAFFAAWLKLVGDKWNTPAGRDIIWRSRSKKAPALLVKIITDKNTPEAEKPRYIRALDFIKGPEKDAALLQLVTAQ
jgi:putative membrane-bound dehydrogenase-like protein